MTYIVCHALYIFFVILECVLFIYILGSWFPNALRFRALLLTLLDPIFVPIRFLLRKSVFYNAQRDLTPMVALILIFYLQSFFYGLAV